MQYSKDIPWIYLHMWGIDVDEDIHQYWTVRIGGKDPGATQGLPGGDDNKIRSGIGRVKSKQSGKLRAGPICIRQSVIQSPEFKTLVTNQQPWHWTYGLNFKPKWALCLEEVQLFIAQEIPMIKW